MKIDCSKTVDFMKEVSRMCSENIYDCKVCPLDDADKGYTCYSFIRRLPEEAIEIVQKWSDEHLVKTRLDDLLEKYPKAKLNADGTPFACAIPLGYINKCETILHCTECWNTPL